MTNTKKIIAAIVIVAVLVIGVGYAAIQNITLNISGTASANADQANFTVAFSGEPTTDKTKVSANSTAASITAAVTDDTNATINVEGLTAKGDVVTATYTIQNTSADLSAKLSATTSNSNTEYFKVTHDLEDATTVTHGQATTITVTVELIKTPITATETATVGVQITAEPVQP